MKFHDELWFLFEPEALPDGPGGHSSSIRRLLFVQIPLLGRRGPAIASASGVIRALVPTICSIGEQDQDLYHIRRGLRRLGDARPMEGWRPENKNRISIEDPDKLALDRKSVTAKGK